MRLSEIKGKRAIECVADLIDPIKVIVSDEFFKKIIQKDKLEGVKYLLKNHQDTVIIILAILNGENPDTYEPTLLTLPGMLFDLIDDPAVAELFGLQDQSTEKTSSGPVTENIEATQA